MFQADPRGILALVAVAMCLVLAVVLYRVGTRGSVARKLSLLLVVEAVTLGSSSSVEFLLVSPTATIEAYPRWYEIMFLVHTLGDCAMLALYPPFLAAALQTPMTRPFADKRVQAGLAVAAIALFVFLQVGPIQDRRCAALLRTRAGLLVRTRGVDPCLAHGERRGSYEGTRFRGGIRHPRRLLGSPLQHGGLGPVGRVVRMDLGPDRPDLFCLRARYTAGCPADRVRHPARAPLRHRPAHPLDDQAVDAGRGRRGDHLRTFGRCESPAVVRAGQCRRPAGRGARGVLPGPAATVRRSRRQRGDAEHAEHARSMPRTASCRSTNPRSPRPCRAAASQKRNGRCSTGCGTRSASPRPTRTRWSATCNRTHSRRPEVAAGSQRSRVFLRHADPRAVSDHGL